MWREFDAQGYLVYSFAETVAALHPYYLMRLFGGLLYLSGALVMAYNLIQTVRGAKSVPAAASVVAAE
jgi:cytochrome c oxidase cbb3-type subunit 1